MAPATSLTVRRRTARSGPRDLGIFSGISPKNGNKPAILYSTTYSTEVPDRPERWRSTLKWKGGGDEERERRKWGVELQPIQLRSSDSLEPMHSVELLQLRSREDPNRFTIPSKSDELTNRV
jgi:hypothetical protein